MIYKKICSVVNPESDQAKDISRKISDQFSQCSWQIVDNFDFSNISTMDLVVAIGGDGTLLRAVSLSIKYDVPVLGINMGNVGFMTEIEGDNAILELEHYLENSVRVEERSLLEVDFQKDNKNLSYKALNDIVLARGSSVSMIETITEIDGIHFATYRGDGIVLSTSTGSTGYSLALGGPVIDPKSNDYYIKPIATHMSQFGGVIVSSDSSCEITVSSRKDAQISIDGFIEHELSSGDKIRVKISDTKAKFLRKNPPNHYWSTITEKLGIRKGNFSK